MDNNGEEEIKVILIGESGTGKTSLINATMGLKFKEHLESTTTNSFSSKKVTINNKEYILNLWDTIGQEKFRSLTKIFIKDSKIVILVYDITRKESFEQLDFWHNMIHDILGDEPVLGICGNKSDLFVREQVKEETIKKYSEDKKIPFKLTSAKNPLTFNKFLEELVKQYIEKNGGVTTGGAGGKVDLKKELLKKYGRIQGPLYFNSPIYFGLNFKKKEKKDKEEKENEEEKKPIKGFIDYLSPFDYEIKSLEELLDFDKISFIKEYHTKIIYSKSLYEIKRLMPSLFLLSILHLALNKYRSLFGLNEDWFKNKKEWEDLVINSKVTLLISKASSDGSTVSKSSIPSWCKNLSIDCGFLTKYDGRSLLFKVSFDPRRSLVNLQNYFKSIDPNYPNEYNITLEKSMRLKIIVNRNKILDHGFTLLNDAVTSKFFGFLEFEYEGEIGNGLGPTLEFFYLVFDQLRANTKLWYKTTDGSLYPNLGLNENDECIKLFKLLGYIIGRAIYDDRLMDIPLSRVFWSLLLERPVLLKDLNMIDKNLYKGVKDFLNLISKKKELIKNNPSITDEEIENKVLYNNKKLSELDLYFTFPGYNEVELKEGGSDILLTMKNVEEYVNLIYDFIFYRGIDRVVNAFKDGFCLIYNIFNLKCFTSKELDELICGSFVVKWDEDTLYENLKPEHGYTKSSRIFNDLIKFMCKLDKNGQKQFLIFTTGTSRLPIGGFKSLSPKLTIVKRAFDQKEFPDDYLPTVMTCQNYLKLPEYSSYQILENKLLLAMKEGSKEFNLS